MDDWLARYAAALEERLGRAGPRVRLPPDAVSPLLALARDVAHATERRNAPLAAYLVGRYVALREAGGADPAEALAEAREAAGATLPEA